MANRAERDISSTEERQVRHTRLFKLTLIQKSFWLKHAKLAEVTICLNLQIQNVESTVSFSDSPSGCRA